MLLCLADSNNFFIALSSVSFAKGKGQLEYEISCAGNAKTGFYIVEVSAYVSKKGEIGTDIVKKCALHGVLFKGFSGSDGCHSQKQLLTTFNETHSALINNLVASEYGKYTETIGIPLKVIKQNKRYKVTAIIQVAKDLLRKDLEESGVIRKLGF